MMSPTTSHSIAHDRFVSRWRPAAVAVTCAIALGSLAAAAPAAADVPRSTGTVLVAAADAPALRSVGTSTITVLPGTTAAQALAQVRASDQSTQTRSVRSADGVERLGAVESGDQIVVTAEDGVTVGSYTFEVWDPESIDADGDYWDQAHYNEIDAEVNAATPTFPDRTCDVTDAAYADEVRTVTERYANGNEAGRPSATTSPLTWAEQEVVYYGDAIAAAVEDCHAAGGGIVSIPAGGSQNADTSVYYSGSIELLSGVNLRVETGATVKFMRNKTNEYYPLTLTSYEGTDIYNFSSFIHALGQENIAVTGGGTLDGQEDMWNWRPWKKGYWGELSVEDRSTTASYGQQGILNQMNQTDTPIEHRIFTDDGSRPDTIPVIEDGEVVEVPLDPAATVLKSTFRPHFIEANHSRNILIEDVKLRNTAFWQIHPLNSENVLVRGVDISSNKTTGYESSGWNNDDGIDPESTRNVVIEDAKVTVSDDGVAIKAGRNRNGREHRDPSERIIVRNSEFRNDGGNSAGVSVGSEMSGSVRDVFVHDMTFGGTGLVMGFKFKTNSIRGGSISGFKVRDIKFTNVNWSVVEFDGDYPETSSAPNSDVFDPLIRDVSFDRVHTDAALPSSRNPQMFRFTTAVPRSPVRDIRVRDVSLHSTQNPASAFSTNKFIADLTVENLAHINRTSGVTSTYSTKPIGLVGPTAALIEGTDAVELDATAGDTSSVTALPSDTFRLTGKVDLSNHPTFVSSGQVRVYVDRVSTPVAATISADGTFITAPITLNDDQPWYRDRHYIAVNLSHGLDITTEVFHVSANQTPVAVELPAFAGPAIGENTDVSASFTHHGDAGDPSIDDVSLALNLPDGWTSTPIGPTQFAAVEPASSVTATWRVTRAGGTYGPMEVSASTTFTDPANGLSRVVRSQPRVVDVDPISIELADVAVAAPTKLRSVLIGELGATHYVDRTNTLTSYPASLTGAVLIPGANDDKRVAGNSDYLRFSSAHDSTVYVALDERGRGAWWPAWVSQQGFVETPLRARADDGSQTKFVLFSKRVAAGQPVSLGANGASSNDSASYFTLVASYEQDAAPLTVDGSTQWRCVGGKAVLAVSSTNDNDEQVDVEFTSAYGRKAFAAVLPSRTVFHSFTTRSATVPAGEVRVTYTTDTGGETRDASAVLATPAHTC